MDSAGLEKEINRGKGLLTEIVRATTDFLERLETLAPAEIRAFEKNRQRLLKELMLFQSQFNLGVAGKERELPLAMARQLEEFRIFREVFVQIIMEKNAAIISRATNSLDKVRFQLDAVARGRQAVRGYNRKRGQTWNCLEKTA